MHNSFILQQYVCYITILNMFRAARCSSSGGQIVSDSRPHFINIWSFTDFQSDDTRGCGDTIGPPDDEQRAVRNMLKIVM